MKRNGSRDMAAARRGGNTGGGGECRQSSMGRNLLALAGGVGLGAGLLYLLDPDKGVQRRRQIMQSAGGLGRSLADRASDWGASAGETARGLASSAGEYASDAAGSAGGMLGGALSSVKNFVSDKFGGVSDYASEKAQAARDLVHEKVCGETRAQHRIGVTICALSSMAIGAALMYVFDPSMGRARRQVARDKASELASQAASTAGEYAHAAGDKLRSGYESAKDKVGGMASNLTGSGGTSSSKGTTGGAAVCPPGMTSVSGPTGADLTL